MGRKIYAQYEDPLPLSTNFKGFSLSKFEYQDVLTILEHFVQVMPTLPDWPDPSDASQNYTGRLVFAEDTNKLCVGGNTDWFCLGEAEDIWAAAVKYNNGTSGLTAQNVQDAIDELAGASGIDHNSLAGLQGGTTDEYYHLTSSRHAKVAAIGDLAVTDGNFIVGNGSTWISESGSTARASLGLGTIATQNANSVNIDGGAIDGTTIGANSAAAGKFSDLTNSALTSGRVPYATTDGQLIDSANFTFNGTTLTATDAVLDSVELKDVTETQTTPESSSGTLVLNLENSNVFEVELDENVTTLTISNPSTSGKASSFTLIVAQDSTGGYEITWPASVKWAGGLEPTQTTDASAIDVYTFITTDAGTTWYGFQAGADFS